MLNGKTLKNLLLIVFLVSGVKLIGQIETVKYSKEEFEKIKSIREALKDFPEDCTIKSYEISMAIGGSIKTVKYNSKKPDSSTTSNFFNIAVKQGGIIVIDKMKTSCPSSSHKSKYKIVVE
jgi:hypothetical protein